MIFTWISKIFSSFALYAVIGVFIAGTSVFYTYRHDVKKLQHLQDQVATLNQAVKEQQIANQELRQLIQLNVDSISNLNDEKEQIKQSVDNLGHYLDEKTTVKQDRASSNILKKTIEALRKRR